MRLLDGPGGTGLLDDARIRHGGDLTTAVEAHLALRSGPYAPLLGGLVIPDQRLTELSRLVGDHPEPLPVVAVNTSGAGGLLALAGRRLPGLRLLRVESALRDPADLAANAARVVAAAAELGELEIAVEVPDGHGVDEAVAEIEAGGLIGQVVLDEVGWQQRVLAMVEADLPFCLRSLPGVGQDGSTSLVAALDAVAHAVDGSRAVTIEPARLRRRLRAVSCDRPDLEARLLVDAGLLGSPTG